MSAASGAACPCVTLFRPRTFWWVLGPGVVGLGLGIASADVPLGRARA